MFHKVAGCVKATRVVHASALATARVSAKGFEVLVAHAKANRL